MIKKRKIDIFLVLILLLSAALNLYGIWNSDTDNAYYTAAVTSMTQSFHNFFYASFDPGGFVTVDKPPVALWVQTLFALVFGVHGWSVVLPEGIAEVISVALLYFIVKPTFGKTAARISALVMACTPIAVAVSHTNNVDSILVLCLMIATWMLFKAVRTGKISWLLASFFMVGVGFNVKMLQAYMVLPAFMLFYLIAAKTTIRKKIVSLITSVIVLAAVSVSWAVVVDSQPESSRPYIGSSQTNSVLELAFGYNGVQRLTGQSGAGGGKAASDQTQKKSNQEQQSSTASSSSSSSNGQMTPPSGGEMPSSGPGGQQGDVQSGGGPGGGRNGAGSFGTGTPGPLRLFQSELSGQASWLIPFVLFGIIALLITGLRGQRKFNDTTYETIFWTMWLLPVAAFFSVAGFFHHYYLIMLAAPIAALSGTGWTALVRLYQEESGWKKWLLPIGILLATAFELYILIPYISDIGITWIILVGAFGIITSCLLFFVKKGKPFSYYVSLAALLGMLIGPFCWTTATLADGVNGMIPQAGPQSAQSFGGGGGKMNNGSRPPGFGSPTVQDGQTGNQPNSGNNRSTDSSSDQNSQNQNGGSSSKTDQGRPNGSRGGPGSGESVDKDLLSYLEKHNTGEKYLFAVSNANSASSYIIKTGKAVMAMGGFSGSDPILTVDKLKKLVKNGEVKYFMIGNGRGQDNSDITNWIKKHGTEIKKSEYSSSSSGDSSQSGGPGGNQTLYKVELD
ncbi:glycosyltransferase family 39 protein [Bacillus sonorensis]|uniref:glycosyltransferase family 39 protein n=1 Tax=Bacillus sonorensis TaxID=119858 RepID=UPI000497BB90|nr:glycosyltransferase family 39 protein [Bacillus sonorensis]MEC1354530.1 glycosyltransferase family 39 protein [Bacillus sonorensis]MEC1425246.1 glycosyltransferase family 39 protein [Bacillus sonorensis]MEC1589375.1 glycosyltransferase family 39 protein [Bacillus sonorensis]